MWIGEEGALPNESDVVVRSGQHELSWTIMSRFLQKSRELPGLDVDIRILDLINAITEIRSPS